jgi:hypothetical protein
MHPARSSATTMSSEQLIRAIFIGLGMLILCV